MSRNRKVDGFSESSSIFDALGNKTGDKLAGRKSNPQKEITNNTIHTYCKIE